MTNLCRSICSATLSALVALTAAISTDKEVFAQQIAPSALKVAENSSFFKDRKGGESAAVVVASLESAVKAGADVNEADSDGNSAFTYALAYSVTNIDGVKANSIVKALFRLGVDVNKPIGPTVEALHPICAPLIWGTFNYDLSDILLDAGASTKVKCNGLSLEDTARTHKVSFDLL